MKGWGTWEELLLGGAILRHGTKDWNIVATELRARTVFPYTITPEVKSTINNSLNNFLFSLLDLSILKINKTKFNCIISFILYLKFVAYSLFSLSWIVLTLSSYYF